jgi:two-component system LytT family response regulator
MKPLRVLVADDEPLARERMTDLLGETGEVELLAAVAGGAAAIESIRKLQPDLAMLDVDMPKVDGFDVVEAVLSTESAAEAPPPLFCFVTAYPQFALEAFDKGAIDFLAKPVRLVRLRQALSRARSAIEGREASTRLQELSGQLDELRRTRIDDQGQALWLQSRGEMFRLDLPAVEWVKAEGEYVRLHYRQSEFLMRSSISAFCESFGESGIVQVHRSFAINPAHLKSVRSSRSGVRLTLQNGAEVPVGRKFRKVVGQLTGSASHR